MVHRKPNTSSLFEAVNTSPVFIVLVIKSDLAVSLGGCIFDTLGSNTEVPVLVVQVEFGSEGQFLFLVFLGCQLKEV